MGLKKKELFEGFVSRVQFPNKGIVEINEEKIELSGVIPGQKIKGVVTNKRKSKIKGVLLEVLEKSKDEMESRCPHFYGCGGCTYQNLPYHKQLELKSHQVQELLKELDTDYIFEAIVGSESPDGYRNKMEYTFGDEFIAGPLALGLHKRNTMYDIINTDHCLIVNDDFNLILSATRTYFAREGSQFLSKKDHMGYLRHLVVRRGVKTQEILVNLITTSQEDVDLSAWVQCLEGLPLQNQLVGILHTINDSLADIVQPDQVNILAGRDYFYDEILGMRFKISPFSFFQTNTLGAEKLYSVVREYVGSTKDKVVFDLYSGTGTITQLLAPVAKKAVGVEIVEEAVVVARENAAVNQLSNCEFIAGDVLKVLDRLMDKPDVIILDPPRDGIHPKALEKIIAFGVDHLVYVSCKPTSLVRDLKVFLESGYRVEKVRCVDLFPNTVHVETVVLMSKVQK